MIAEVVVDNGLTNIVAERYDAGVRLGEQGRRPEQVPHRHPERLEDDADAVAGLGARPSNPLDGEVGG